MGRIIGIDLGTTTSEVAVLDNGVPRLLKNKDGARIIPSVVAVKDGKFIVGEEAKNDLRESVSEIKRKMGSIYRVSLAGEKYMPQELSAVILRYLKDFAEYILEEEVDEAVITVPAMFDSTKRQATKHAAEIAGLKVDRIINEPTAAALAYGLMDFDMEKEEKVIVYDLGGGTFDVTILEIHDGIIEVKCSMGDNYLGGKDFDERIMQYTINEIYRINEIDIRNCDAALRIIKDEAEKAKKRLTDQDETSIVLINLPSSDQPDCELINMDIRLTRSQFNLMVGDLVRRTEQILDEALQQADLTDADVNTFLLVGGSTKMGVIRSTLEKRFGSKVKKGVDPEEVVAIGAAIQAGLKRGDFDSESEILITDVCPFSLGTDVVASYGGKLVAGLMDVMIKKNSYIPNSVTKEYATVHDGQTAMSINVYEGEEKFAKDNILQGEFTVDGIPEDEAGSQVIEVTFAYDLNSTLKVDTKIVSTGKTESKVFCLKGMNEDEVIKARSRLNARYENKWGGSFKPSDVVKKDDEKWKSSPMYESVSALLTKSEQLLPTLTGPEKFRLMQIMDLLKEALSKNDTDAVKRYDEALTDLLFDLQ